LQALQTAGIVLIDAALGLWRFVLVDERPGQSGSQEDVRVRHLCD